MSEEERDLVLALRRGDRGAFDRAYARHAPAVFSFLLRLTRRRDVAEDLHQETWVKLARKAPTLAEDTRLVAWLFTVARNAFVSERRWAMLDLTRIFAFGAEASTHAEGDLEGQTDARRRVSALEDALAAVSATSREVLLLVAVEGLEQADVARILGLSAEALRQRLSRARKELEARLAGTPRAARTDVRRERA